MFLYFISSSLPSQFDGFNTLIATFPYHWQVPSHFSTYLQILTSTLQRLLSIFRGKKYVFFNDDLWTCHWQRRAENPYNRIRKIWLSVRMTRWNETKTNTSQVFTAQYFNPEDGNADPRFTDLSFGHKGNVMTVSVSKATRLSNILWHS